jgi:predicted PolB exonuclease-like 3'-5' exonuclease
MAVVVYLNIFYDMKQSIALYSKGESLQDFFSKTSSLHHIAYNLSGWILSKKGSIYKRSI